MLANNTDTLFLQQRQRLFGLAYRMLGSVMDAEDAVQDAFVRWSELDRAAIREPSAFLTTLVARRCIDELRSARHRRETYVGPWLPDPLVADPSATAEQDESIGVAFLLLLERLGPVERAVFVLREVFDYPYSEIGPIVGRSAVNCRQIMSRARKAVGDLDQGRAPAGYHDNELVERFVQAVRDGDMQQLLGTLADDVVLLSDGGGVVAAARKPITGPAAVVRAVLGVARKADPRAIALPALINGDAGFVFMLDGQPVYTFALGIENGAIRHLYSVVNPHKLRHLIEYS